MTTLVKLAKIRLGSPIVNRAIKNLSHDRQNFVRDKSLFDKPVQKSGKLKQMWK